MADMDYDEFLAQLKALLKAEKTGGFLGPTSRGGFLIIALKEGEIISISYGMVRGVEAIPIIRRMERCSCIFDDKTIIPPQRNLPATEWLIRMLEKRE